MFCLCTGRLKQVIRREEKLVFKIGDTTLTIYTEIEKAPDRKPNAFFENTNNLNNKLPDINTSIALSVEKINRILNIEFLRLFTDQPEYEISCSRPHNDGERFQSSHTSVSDARNHGVAANALCDQSLTPELIPETRPSSQGDGLTLIGL